MSQDVEHPIDTCGIGTPHQLQSKWDFNNLYPLEDIINNNNNNNNNNIIIIIIIINNKGRY